MGDSESIWPVKVHLFSDKPKDPKRESTRPSFTLNVDAVRCLWPRHLRIISELCLNKSSINISTVSCNILPSEWLIKLHIIIIDENILHRWMLIMIVYPYFWHIVTSCIVRKCYFLLAYDTKVYWIRVISL